jgi:hypothetical protein
MRSAGPVRVALVLAALTLAIISRIAMPPDYIKLAAALLGLN